MNLNFIQDNDQIHVETQNQFTYKQQIILKSQLLKQDFNDYSQIHPILLQISNLFIQIVKSLYQHLTNIKQKQTEVYSKKSKFNQIKDGIKQLSKKKNKVSIPYVIFKKLEILKHKFITCRNLVQWQNLTYRNFNINSQNQKKSDLKFYKQILSSYESQRQYFKKQTLKLEQKVQQVESQVRKLSSNQNHIFTDYKSKVIEIEGLFQIQKKIRALQSVINELNLLKKIKQKIFDLLKVVKSDEKEKSKSSFLPATSASNLFNTSSNISKKINLIKGIRTEIFQRELHRQKRQISNLKGLNQGLKKGILMNQTVKYFLELQDKILNLQKKRQIFKKQHKITKTDYMIYLKQLNNQLNQYIKSKQIVYHIKMPNQILNRQKKSKSFSKY